MVYIRIGTVTGPSGQLEFHYFFAFGSNTFLGVRVGLYTLSHFLLESLSSMLDRLGITSGLFSFFSHLFFLRKVYCHVKRAASLGKELTKDSFRLPLSLIYIINCLWAAKKTLFKELEREHYHFLAILILLFVIINANLSLTVNTSY